MEYWAKKAGTRKFWPGATDEVTHTAWDEPVAIQREKDELLTPLLATPLHRGHAQGDVETPGISPKAFFIPSRSQTLA